MFRRKSRFASGSPTSERVGKGEVTRSSDHSANDDENEVLSPKSAGGPRGEDLTNDLHEKSRTLIAEKMDQMDRNGSGWIRMEQQG